eukprot:TRINITY_DN7296_c0_g2_i2.p1 TRINITY_DN7296_c0_g2~~TRINITY_DN7296_c0_g2_i2.p1  ORF type:complete len:409 (+),score=111.84 TRINITY_DN7296_c0_g2_i2:829-2055(+)
MTMAATLAREDSFRLPPVLSESVLRQPIPEKPNPEAERREKEVTEIRKERDNRRAMQKLREILKSEDYICEEWDLMDPFDNTPQKSFSCKAFVKGVTYHMPPHLLPNASAVQRRPPQRRQRSAAAHGPGVVVNGRHPFFVEFGYLYKRELQRRMAERRTQKRRPMRGVPLEPEELMEKESVEQLAPDRTTDTVDDVPIPNEVIFRSDGTQEFADGTTAAGDDDDDTEMDVDIGAGDETGGHVAPPTVDGDEVTVAPSAYGGPSESLDALLAADDNLKQQSYEDLLRAHHDLFLERERQETDLIQRIADWHTKLSPLIDEQETRESFDIKVYNKRLLDLMTEHGATVMGKTVAFAELTGDMPRWEVCRQFASLLQLIFSGNVELVDRSNLTLKVLTLEPLYDIETAFKK